MTPRGQRVINWILYSWFRIVIALAATLAVLAGFGYLGVTLANPSHDCGSPGVNHTGGSSSECVGVTDGRYDFLPSLHAVDQAILAENNKVGTGSGVATVALLAPLIYPDSSMKTDTLHILQGAYVAQYRADELSGGRTPKIRLVVANAGLDLAHWQSVVRQLGGMTGAPDNLRAVTGLDVSNQPTKDELTWLTSRGIPVVGGTITGDDLANPDTDSDAYPGLARIAPTNRDEAAALADVGTVDRTQTLLVEDTGQKGDDYIATLAKAFSGVTNGAPFQPVRFSSPADVDSEGDTATQFFTDATTICTQAPRYIYFAGRHVQLRQFINQLGQQCPKKPFTVVTGDDADHLNNDPLLDRTVFGPQRITLEYAALATPTAWTGSALKESAPYAQGYQDFTNAIQHAFPGNTALTTDQLRDGDGMIAYDSLWTTFQALSLLAGLPGHNGRLPSLAELAQEWPTLHGPYRIYGASGWICLDNGGNPYDKAVPVVEYDGGQPQFIHLSWPTGKPPTDACSA